MYKFGSLSQNCGNEYAVLNLYSSTEKEMVGLCCCIGIQSATYIQSHGRNCCLRSSLLTFFRYNFRYFRWNEAAEAWNWPSPISSSIRLNGVVVHRYKTCPCFSLFQEMPDGGLCDHGQHQRVRYRGPGRQGAHVAQPMLGRPAVHPHNSYSGESTDLD